MLRYRYGKVEFHNIIDDMGRAHPEHHGQQVVPPAPNINMAGADTSAVAMNNGQGGTPSSWMNQTPTIDPKRITDLGGPPVAPGIATGAKLQMDAAPGGYPILSEINPTVQPPKTWGDLGAGISGALGGVADVMGLGQTTDTAGQIGYQERTEFSPDPTWEAWAAPPVPTHEEVVRADQDFLMAGAGGAGGRTFTDAQGNQMPTQAFDREAAWTDEEVRAGMREPQRGTTQTVPSGEVYVYTGGGHINGWQRQAELGPEFGGTSEPFYQPDVYIIPPAVAPALQAGMDAVWGQLSDEVKHFIKNSPRAVDIAQEIANVPSGFADYTVDIAATGGKQMIEDIVKGAGYIGTNITLDEPGWIDPAMMERPGGQAVIPPTSQTTKALPDEGFGGQLHEEVRPDEGFVVAPSGTPSMPFMAAPSDEDLGGAAALPHLQPTAGAQDTGIVPPTGGPTGILQSPTGAGDLAAQPDVQTPGDYEGTAGYFTPLDRGILPSPVSAGELEAQPDVAARGPKYTEKADGTVINTATGEIVQARGGAEGTTYIPDEGDMGAFGIGEMGQDRYFGREQGKGMDKPSGPDGVSLNLGEASANAANVSNKAPADVTTKDIIGGQIFTDDFTFTAPATLDTYTNFNNTALAGDMGAHGYLKNLMDVQNVTSEISIPPGYEIEEMGENLRIVVDDSFIDKWGEFGMTLRSPAYLSKVEKVLNQNKRIQTMIDAKIKQDFDINLAAHDPEHQTKLTQIASKHDAEISKYSQDLKVQEANITGLFDGKPTMTKKQLTAELTGMWEGLPTMDREKMVSALTGKYDGKDTIDTQKFKTDATGWLYSEDGKTTVRTVMGQQTDIMRDKADAEIMSVAGQAMIQYLDPETGEMMSKLGKTLEKEIADHGAKIDYLKLTGQGVDPETGMTIQTLERMRFDKTNERHSQIDAMERAKMMSETTGYVYTPVKDAQGNWSVQQSETATINRDALNMQETVADIAAKAKTDVATTQATAASAVATINANSASAVQTLRNTAIELGIDKDISLLTKRIEQEFANAGIAATAASTARVAEYEMRKKLVQAEIDAALNKEATEFDRQQAARELEFTNNLAKEESFKELELSQHDQFIIDRLEADQAYQLALTNISNAAAVTGAETRGEQERETLGEQQRLDQLGLEQKENFLKTLRDAEREFLAIKPGEGVEGAKTLSNNYMTSLNSAIAGAVESGNYEDVNTVLGSALPPTPAGILWDRNMGAFQQREGFEGREMDFATQQWMAAVTPAFKARDRAEQATTLATQAQSEAMIRTQERRQAEDDFRQAMLTSNIDTAEEAIARQHMAETAAIASDQKMEHVKMLFNLLQNPVQLGMAKRHGLLGQIEAVLGFTMNNVPEAPAGGAGVPSANAWQTMDSENQAFSIAAYVEQGGSPDDFMRMIASSIPAQMQQVQYGVL